MKDLHSNIKVLRAIEPKAVGTTGASNGTLGPVIDRKGWNSVEFALLFGTSASAVDTVTPVVYESDSATAASFTSVADADLLGTEAGARMPAAARTTGVGSNLASKIGYRGNKRYLRLRLYGIGTATALVAAAAVLSDPQIAPESTQIN